MEKFNELTDKEFNFFYEKENQYKVIAGMLGVLREEIAFSLASDGSFQSEIGEIYCPEDQSVEDFVLNSICGSGSTQYELADSIIEDCTPEQLKEKMYYYSIIGYDGNLERHFPDFSKHNRSGREYYIEAENDSEISKEFKKFTIEEI